jgi:hypothetical protein
MITASKHDELITGLQLRIKSKLLIQSLRMLPQVTAGNKSRRTILLRSLLACNKKSYSAIPPNLIILVGFQLNCFGVEIHVIAMKFLPLGARPDGKNYPVVDLWRGDADFFRLANPALIYSCKEFVTDFLLELVPHDGFRKCLGFLDQACHSTGFRWEESPFPRLVF